MTTKVGLMGFGRIGRNLFCILYKRDDMLGLFHRLSSASDSSSEAGHSSSR